MNTKQLAALWYTGLIIIGILLTYEANQYRTLLWPGIVSIVILGGLFIYTFRPHPAANKKALLTAVLTPVLLLIAVVVVATVVSNRPTGEASDIDDVVQRIIRRSQVEVFDARLGFGTFGTATLTGRIRNNTDAPITSVGLRVLIYADSVQVDGADVSIRFSPGIPVGQARSFEQTVTGLKPPEKWTWNYKVTSVY